MHSPTTLISTTRRTTTVASPCCSRRGADDPSAASLFVSAGVSSAYPPSEATGHRLPPEGITTTWAHAGVLRHRWAEAEEGAAEHETCLFPRRLCREEGEDTLNASHVIGVVQMLCSNALYMRNQSAWHTLIVCYCLQRWQVLTWQLPWQHGRQTQVNIGQYCQQCISYLESGHRSSLKHLKYHQHYHSNITDRAWCPINLYLPVCSERRSRGDRYDSMVSAVHALMLLCVCSFPAVCRRCLRFIFQTRQLEFLFSECSMSTEADTVMPFHCVCTLMEACCCLATVVSLVTTEQLLSRDLRGEQMNSSWNQDNSRTGSPRVLASNTLFWLEVEKHCI